MTASCARSIIYTLLCVLFERTLSHADYHVLAKYSPPHSLARMHMVVIRTCTLIASIAGPALTSTERLPANRMNLFQIALCS
jgi:hypothetical protein